MNDKQIKMFTTLIAKLDKKPIKSLTDDLEELR